MKKPISSCEALCLFDLSAYVSNDSINTEYITLFQQIIYTYYDQNRREFSWRNTQNPYHIVVSEIMLQQTQTHRVIEKFEQFLKAFPTIQSLAHAPFSAILAEWQGLGYNRRAQYLHLFAQRIVTECDGIIPANPGMLTSFKGIGPNTAGSICAFAFNMPTVFIETNIRAVFIHTFFKDKTQITDRSLMTLITQTVDKENPREWYYALMDYGVMLKKTTPNPSRKSAHHTTQSKFEGSNRQIRSHILRLLLKHNSLPLTELIQLINKEESRISSIITQLVKERLLIELNGSYQLST